MPLFLAQKSLETLVEVVIWKIRHFWVWRRCGWHVLKLELRPFFVVPGKSNGEWRTGNGGPGA